MTIELLEEKIRNRFFEKYDKRLLEGKKDFFIIQVRGSYKNKEVRFNDLIGNEVPVLTIMAENYNDCFESLIESF